MCFRCAPKRYGWSFRCACLQGGRTVADYEDDRDHIQCSECAVWTHTPPCSAATGGATTSSGGSAEDLTEARKAELIAEEADGAGGMVDFRCPWCVQKAGSGGTSAAVGKGCCTVEPSEGVRIEVRSDKRYGDRKIIDEIWCSGVYERPVQLRPIAAADAAQQRRHSHEATATEAAFDAPLVCC